VYVIINPDFFDITENSPTDAGRQELLYTQLFNRFCSGLPVNRETLVDIDDTVINSLSNAIFDFKLLMTLSFGGA
jgi:hypothetical protein